MSVLHFLRVCWMLHDTSPCGVLAMVSLPPRLVMRFIPCEEEARRDEVVITSNHSLPNLSLMFEAISSTNLRA